MVTKEHIADFRWRKRLLLAVVLLAAALLAWRTVYLQVMSRQFLQTQGDARHLRVVTMPASRGMVLDRHGEPLAISTPVESVWANPMEMGLDHAQVASLARTLEMDSDELQRLLARGDRQKREFVYLKRHVTPAVAEKVLALNIPGVATHQEYRRYYPAGEVTSHVLGFTNVDDQGQEGIELAFNEWLQGESGSKRVIKDRLGRVVENVESIRPASPGKNLTLSIDRRIQYLAYRELKAAVKQHNARSASAVVLDVSSGEVLAMVNQPSFNPNLRKRPSGARYRNRALTDVFEPGSTVKPFTIAAALESGKYSPSTPISTSPGYFKVGRNTIRDARDYGTIDVSSVITYSSNVGASKIALSLKPETLWSMYDRIGFGRVTGSGFPGESGGLMTPHYRWHEIEQATHAFGYGLSVTPLQLAQAYAVLAADGVMRPVSFLRQEQAVAGDRVISARVAHQVRNMMETVVSDKGTGKRAAVAGYRVAGKTGTAHKSAAGGYAEDRYVSVFAGMAPASKPRLVMVVMLNEPRAGDYYGGVVAAPVFSRVMAGALRLMNIAPDDLPERSPVLTYAEAQL